jgi:hypothetical protein
VQALAYPKGRTMANKITTLNEGDWSIAASPDAVL